MKKILIIIIAQLISVYLGYSISEDNWQEKCEQIQLLSKTINDQDYVASIF